MSSAVVQMVNGLHELNLEDTGFGPEIVKRALITALGRKQRERELVSRLLVDILAANIVTRDSAWEGFKLLLGAR